MQQPRVEVVQEGGLWVVEAELGAQPERHQQQEWRVGPFPSQQAAQEAATLLRRKMGSSASSPLRLPPGGAAAAAHDHCSADEDEDLRNCSLEDLVEALQEHAVGSGEASVAAAAAQPASTEAPAATVSPAVPGALVAAGEAPPAHHTSCQLQQRQQDSDVTAPGGGKAAGTAADSGGGAQEPEGRPLRGAARRQQPGRSAAPPRPVAPSQSLPVYVYQSSRATYHFSIAAKDEQGRVRNSIYLGSCRDASEAAVARDLAVLWRRMNGLESASAREVALLFAQERYEADRELMQQVRQAANQEQIKALLAQLRDTGKLQQLAWQQEDGVTGPAQHAGAQAGEAQQQEQQRRASRKQAAPRRHMAAVPAPSAAAAAVAAAASGAAAAAAAPGSSLPDSRGAAAQDVHGREGQTQGAQDADGGLQESGRQAEKNQDQDKYQPTFQMASRDGNRGTKPVFLPFCASAQQAAALRDIGLLWRGLKGLEKGVVPMPFHFPKARYQAQGHLMARLRQARSEAQLKALVRELRDSGELEALVGRLTAQQGSGSGERRQRGAARGTRGSSGGGGGKRKVPANGQPAAAAGDAGNSGRAGKRQNTGGSGSRGRADAGAGAGSQHLGTPAASAGAAQRARRAAGAPSTRSAGPAADTGWVLDALHGNKRRRAAPAAAPAPSPAAAQERAEQRGEQREQVTAGAATQGRAAAAGVPPATNVSPAGPSRSAAAPPQAAPATPAAPAGPAVAGRGAPATVPGSADAAAAAAASQTGSHLQLLEQLAAAAGQPGAEAAGLTQELIGSYFLSQQRAQQEWERAQQQRERAQQERERAKQEAISMLAQRGLWGAVATIIQAAPPPPGQ